MVSSNHNNQNKIALINDYSGFGRCSTAVQLPIMSMLQVQCCPLPTAIFSNHTGFEHFSYQDYTPHMEEYINMWDELGLKFKGITTGFLGSEKQIDIVSSFIDRFGKGAIVVIDPVMGDNGRKYATYTDKMCQSMRRLVEKADIVTPNLTEACILTGTAYHDEWKNDELKELAEKVADIGVGKVVITGIPQKSFMGNICFTRDGSGETFSIVRTKKAGSTRSGTGDIFAAVISADAVNGIELVESVKRASLFIKKCILKAEEMDIPITDGVPFEEVLHTMKRGK